MIEYNHLCDRVETLDRQIEEISLKEEYVEKVQQDVYKRQP